ncbi:OLC1v1002479C1 [Oldenlandia corymbosa var. corymbosa]|uniref:OLC1v1002479C1 n=1 Tax=Oldenlandia corymbosa var. corymbosa TaxID=529605 RepID=A0AAV1D7Q5_OLDCO|nr:OLC1v1002479C1 [Oldenlandia corymbosa var. corymbosa]
MGRLLPRQRNPASWADVLLGPGFLPVQDPGIRRHALDHPQRVPISTAVVPPRVPPRGGGGDVLPVAVDGADAVSGGARDQRLRARADVRLLFAERAGNPAVVEEIGDGLSDCTVRVQLWDIRVDAVLPFYGSGLLRDAGLVLQRRFQCLPLSPLS